MNQVVLSNGLFLYFGKSDAFKFFPKLKRTKARYPLTYLFVIAMEVVSCLLREAMERSSVTACKASRRVSKVSHLLLANDTWIFCKASHDLMMYFPRLRMRFQVISGLKINLDKSELFRWV